MGTSDVTVKIFSQCICLTVVTLIIEDPLLHLPVVLLLAGNHEIRGRQQRLHPKHLIRRAEGFRGLAVGETAPEQRVKHVALRRLAEIKGLGKFFPTFAVIGDLKFAALHL